MVSMESNRELVTHLLSINALRNQHIIEAFTEIDRRDFVPKDKKLYAYEDAPLEIGFGQTISQPLTVALMLEWLSPQKGMGVLDVGSGSGWTTALLAHIVGAKGVVIGVERVQQLVEFGRENIMKYELPQARIELRKKELGWPERAPYDRILVSAASDSVHPLLTRQLSSPGILVLPIKNDIVRIIKNEDGITEEHFEGFAFVPLLEN